MHGCLITEIQSYSLQDGPGIRTTLFIKGCPLHCPWCHNPETQSPNKEIYHYRSKCTACGRCVEACPTGASFLDAGPDAALVLSYDRTRCVGCAACVAACPSGARSAVGQAYQLDDLAGRAVADKPFFDNSGGGVTISGGDPLMFPEFTRRLAKRIKKEGVHLAVETSAFPKFALIEPLLPYVDLFIIDIKTLDPIKYRDVIGGSLSRILSNIERLLRLEKAVRIHLPIIPAFNDTPNDFKAYIAYLAPLANVLDGVDVLPFHAYGENKYTLLGREADYAYQGAKDLEHHAVAPLVDGLRQAGIRSVTVGGLVGLGNAEQGCSREDVCG
ncbi:pyruvate formate lyase-activating protein [Desulfosarcina ovata subsp. sediminis]|uniref:Pyruvate formate lyase-activating protein n=1 Tax=Desulfosarcina ovata subsp. sediminis TaxID=885957 RepID=A0A5K7ZJE2_9BACT|nr:glycyl-radical enzyme activating protein [Desulfosarcina ovata]BBO81001.1 pyruvate formate lyase-activating protein [Desulfosarcina ovata subsp. sediminis]